MSVWKRISLYPTRQLSAVLLLHAFILFGTACGKAELNQPAAAVKPLHFIVYGDTRDGHMIHRRLVALIMARKPDLIIQTGDLVHRGSQADLWKIYDDITGEMRHKYLVYPSRGNHDIGGTGYEARVTAPFTSGNKLYYSFDRDRCHFVCLAIDEYTPYGPDSPQYRWLEKDLAVAQQKLMHIFVFFHVPPYSIGAHGSDLTVRSILCPVLEKYGVGVVFNGHDHIYYRTQRGGITYVVSGGGGAPLYPADPRKGALEGDKWESANHIVDCLVDGNNVTLTALRANGKTIDHFTIPIP